MKKSLNLAVVLMLLALLTACTRSTNEVQKKMGMKNSKTDQVTDSEKKEETKSVERKYVQKYITVSKEEFKLLVSFIEKKGFDVYQDGIASDHQYTFIDSRGTRHGLITIKRDENGKPSMKGTVIQISVWAYKDFKNKGKHQENFYGWVITPIEASLSLFNEKNDKENFADMSVGFNEFLKLAKHSK